MKYAFIEAEKALYPVSLMCRCLRVSRSGYYAWRVRPRSLRARRDDELKVVVRDAHETSRGTYGSPRVHAELQANGVAVGRHRVARLMREEGLKGRNPRRFRRTTDSEHDLALADNILERDFTVEGPNRAWVTDITYVRTWEGWLYLAVVLDLFSRRVVGWATADHMRVELVLEALKMAEERRLPSGEWVHHSDRGVQYASLEYRDALTRLGATCSMSRKGNCWDNAVAESFFSTLKTELLYQRPWPTRREADSAIAEYIEIFYNNQRGHSTLGYLSPADFERLHLDQAAKAA